MTRKLALGAALAWGVLLGAPAAAEDPSEAVLVRVPMTSEAWTLPDGKGRVRKGRIVLSGSPDVPARAVAEVPVPPGDGPLLVSGWVVSPEKHGARLSAAVWPLQSTSRAASGGGREVLSAFFPGRRTGVLAIGLEATGPDVEFSDVRVLTFPEHRVPYSDLRAWPESYSDPNDRRNVFFFGGSTVEGSPSGSFPMIFQFLTETWSKRRYRTFNLGRTAAIMPEHILMWTRIPLKNRPFLSHGPVENFRWTGPETGVPDGVKDLRPAAVVVCSMWNDFINDLFTRDGLVPAREDGTPLTVLYMKAIIESVLRPRDAAASAAVRGLAGVLREYADAGRLTDPSLRLIPRAEAMSLHYRLLLERFIEEIRASHPDIPVVFLTLPFQTTADSSPEMRAYVERTGFRQIITRYTLDLDFWALADRTQVAESRAAARRFPNTRFIDLSGAYRAEVEGLTPKAQVRLGYFMDDLMHFTPPGNQYLADKLFMAWLETVER
jgi:hypothetical protein